MHNHTLLLTYIFFLMGLLFCCSNFAQVKNCNSTTHKRAMYLNSLAFISISFAFILLSIDHVENNFSVLNVQQSSNSSLPLFYRLSGVWGSHSGSMILWCWILSLYSMLASIFVRIKDIDLFRIIMKINGIICIFFGIYTLLTSNPFLSSTEVYYEGKELNPILQDVVLAIHPPLIYIGYLGSLIPFSVCFSLLIQHLKKNGKDPSVHPCVTSLKRITTQFARVSWLFLTIGILLGSWWAYYELGWGGFWFWDPVENASLLPWIALTILLHDTKKSYLSWILCSFFGFYSSILGTFLVRSGLIESVHSFASDNQRGIWIVSFLILVALSFLALFCKLSIAIQNTRNNKAKAVEISIWNQIILCWIYFVVLLGTFYPYFHMQLFQEGISIGPSYYNQMIIPLLFPMMILMIFSNSVNSIQSIRIVKLMHLSAFPVSIALGLLLTTTALIGKSSNNYIFLITSNISSVLLLIISLSLIVSLVKNVVERWFTHNYTNNLRNLNVLLSHLGVGVAVLGLSLWNIFSGEKHSVMYPGDTESFANKVWLFREVNFLKGPNYDCFYGNFMLMEKGSICGVIFPEKRHYYITDSFASKVDIQSSLFADYHIIIGDGNIYTGWATHLYYYPFISLFWASGFFSICGIMYSLYRDKNLSLQR